MTAQQRMGVYMMFYSSRVIAGSPLPTMLNTILHDLCILRIVHCPSRHRPMSAHTVHREEVGDWFIFLTQSTKNVLSEYSTENGQGGREEVTGV